MHRADAAAFRSLGELPTPYATAERTGGAFSLPAAHYGAEVLTDRP